ncbi:reprolysin-like metallopeptidase [Tenacibaculum aestuariivivum]|uniref:reprolysin-like metallopeptidase n=1 Tax=Tenacibaculum aestuariivivum TaxID=2006131 RepID=UPI003AB2FA84
MIINSKFLLLIIFTFFVGNLFSQDFWNKNERKNLSIQQNEILSRKNTPLKYSLISLNLSNLDSYLSKKTKSKNNQKIIALPNSEGVLKKFSIKETPSLAVKLAEKFPMIKSYSGKGIDDPTATAKISIGTNGLHALIYYGNESTIYIDPYTKNKKVYIVYKRTDLKADNNNFKCEVENITKTVISSNQKRNADDGVLRTYRIAIACTNEYSQFHLNNQGIASSATNTVKKATVLSAINTTITRVNAIYERDLAVRMVLVDNNDQLIFLETNGDDGLTNNDADLLIDESQEKCDAIIGDANYDIGHTFSTGGGGLAQVSSVCITGYKGGGITGSSQPINDPYDIDYVAHELGHQFGATHTQNNDCNRTYSTAVEPGSGSTIMGYAGICSPNVQGNSDTYFHAVSIDQMWSHIKGGGGCATLLNMNNNAPTANAGEDKSIPKSTPFILKGVATDNQGLASLTYNWEQIDNELATMPPVSTNTGGPAFRSLPSSTSPNRYLPALTNVVNNSLDQWNVLPDVPRELNFALTVRDNNPGAGNSSRDDIKITVTNAEPFTVTSPNTSVTWNVGTLQTITWNKGTTDLAPINCSKVNIKLSTDGGLTFPIILKENVLNDGVEDITIPNNPTSTARILVEAADNVFYNVNLTNFVIKSTIPTFLVSNETSKQVICNTGNKTIKYTLNFNFVNGFSETVNLSAIGLPNGTTASFAPSTINTNGNVIMTLNNSNNNLQKDYTIIIESKSTSITQKTEALLKIIGSDFSNITTTKPADSAINIDLLPEFKWTNDDNVSSYEIIIATDNSFSNVLINETLSTNSYLPSIPLSGTTTYFWKVKPKNMCGEGVFSTTSNFTTQNPSYCSSTFTDEAGGADHITNVTFNTINNDSSNNTIDGYEDFTDIYTVIKKTESHQISVTFNTDGYQSHCYVFIDWNQDFKFDKNTEKYDLGTKTDDIAIATYDINIPESALLGSTRMRVIVEYDDPTNGYGDGSCDSDHLEEWGETEDYTIFIDGYVTDKNLFSDLKVYPIPSYNSKLTIEFSAKDKDLTVIRLFNVIGQLLETKTFSTISTKFDHEIEFKSISSGIYFLQIQNSGKIKNKKIIIK